MTETSLMRWDQWNERVAAVAEPVASLLHIIVTISG